MPWMHGRSVTGALCVAGWQVAQVLLTLPYSFSQLGMLSGVLLQIFYGFLGSWTAYLISVLYVEYRTRKEREKVDFRNHVIQVCILDRLACVYACVRLNFVLNLTMHACISC